MLLQNNFLKGVLFLFLPYFLLASYYPIYHKSHPNFVYSLEDGNYKVTIKGNDRSIDYALYDGFKFYLPNFTTSYNLQVLRFNSIGIINGYLATTPNYVNEKVVSRNPLDLRFYYTDYKSRNYRQLDYLLNGKIIYYPRVTSLSIEGYNIPPTKHLNKDLYFTFVKTRHNKLVYLVYSFSLTLNKKVLDSFVIKNYRTIIYKKDRRFDYLHTYLMSLNKIPNKVRNKKPIKNSSIYLKKTDKSKVKYVKKTSKPIHKIVNKTKPKPIKKRKKISYHLDIKRLFFMKNFVLPLDEEVKVDVNYKLDLKNINKSIDDNKKVLKKLKHYLNSKLDTNVVVFPKDILKKANGYIDSIYLDGLVDDIRDSIKIEKKIEHQQCRFVNGKINKNCYKNSDYFYKYIYYSLSNNKIPKDEEILGFADYRTFNLMGKYYFENGYFDKAETYLFKAYILAPKKEKPLIAHNISVLFFTKGDLKSEKKGIKYLKKANLAIDYFNLGVCYYIGRGVKESDKKAYIYFKKAANLGLQKAINNIKIMKKYKIGTR